MFVFDGGAPVLKRQTISGRKQRREGRREDAVRTAGKLLALQMQRRAEEEDQKRRDEEQRPQQQAEEEVPENPVYVDELTMTDEQRQHNKKFKKKDQYHLPEISGSLQEMGQPNDPRVMSMEELENYARQFDTGEDINIYDFSKIDFNGHFFQSLPPADRYNILNAARLRSRLRMGYSKDQLENMFPNRMDFSRFQIDRVKERNELTQRLMHVSGMNDNMVGVEGTGRIAGEKGREYVLVRSSGAEGGWALGVIGDKDEGERNKPIDVDAPDEVVKEEEEDSEEDMGFEDVPIEGLNRLPKRPKPSAPTSKVSTADIMRRREAIYKSRKGDTGSNINDASRAAAAPVQDFDEDALFVPEAGPQTNGTESFHNDQYEDDPEELQRAIAMSIENGDRHSSPEDVDWEDAMKDKPALQQDRTFPTSQASEAAGGFMQSSGPFEVEDEDDGMDLSSAMAGTKTSQGASKQDDMVKAVRGEPAAGQQEQQNRQHPKSFDGPLPFESLDLGSSLLGKKKMKKMKEDEAGGFEKEEQKTKENKTTPMPPWFKGDLKQDMDAQKAVEQEDRAKERREREQADFDFGNQPTLPNHDPKEVIDLEAPVKKADKTDVTSVASSEDEVEIEAEPQPTMVEDNDVRMGDIAELARVEPPTQDDDKAVGQEVDQAPKVNEVDEPVRRTSEGVVKEPSRSPIPATSRNADKKPSPAPNAESDDEALEWEESDTEEPKPQQSQQPAKEAPEPAGGEVQPPQSRSPSMTFEDVQMGGDEQPGESQPAQPKAQSPHVSNGEEEKEDDETYLLPKTGTADQSAQDAPNTAAANSDSEHFYSDEEDDDLMHQMATEAEEHARFASQLNNKTTRQNIEEYERELKALRSQQKKDRRDADEVTHIMVTECQQLLKLFGLPYITAPMEAEAQCATLVDLGLVDGIVTDDSDCFLFGGTRIYKNMFNQAKFVECYLTSDLEREFDLTREKLIRIAHLLGSDYTEGLPGIGPVTALEIISEFPESLGSFKEWWSNVQTGAPASEEDKASAFRRKFRKNATKVFLPPTFPDVRVDAAYLTPEVDSDPSVFQWGVPDLDALRSFLMATIGWTQERTDEVLVPVVRDMNRRENEGTQANITGFLGGTGQVGAGAFAPRRRDVGKSKRMEGALEKLSRGAREKRKAAGGVGAGGEEVVDEGDAVIAKSGSGVGDDGTPKKKRQQQTAPRQKQAPKRSNGAGTERKPRKSNATMADTDDEDADEDEDDEPPAKQKKTRKGRPKKKATA